MPPRFRHVPIPQAPPIYETRPPIREVVQALRQAFAEGQALRVERNAYKLEALYTALLAWAEAEGYGLRVEKFVDHYVFWLEEGQG